MEILTDILERIRAARHASHGRVLVAIGGCSRSGKSTLASAVRNRLMADGIDAVVLTADHWIVDARERQPGAGVLHRFEMEPFVAAVDALLSGATVHPPIYDSISRRRTAARSPEGLRLGDGVLIAEGVVALLSKSLCDRAAVKVYVTTDEAERRRRLLEFYVGAKGLPLEHAESLVAGREVDEVPLVKASSAAADILFVSPT